MKSGEIRKLTPGDNPTPLKSIRISRGITQKRLSELSGVPLRSIQCYEARSRDIKKAAFATVSALATTLGCDPQDLLQD